MGFLLAIIYLSFISLGLPDAVLGAAWPVISNELQVPLSYAGLISMIISIGTVVSSLQTARLTAKLGTGKVTVLSVALTAMALLGFSITDSFWLLCLWAIPYGLGAGSVDAALNNYVALHYSSRHMSWLHCMWGVGASLGPYIMGYALTADSGWHSGYLYIGILQVGLSMALFFSLPKWKNNPSIHLPQSGDEEAKQHLSLRDVLAIKGVKQMIAAFFCYCALEQTTGLWTSSYLVLTHGLSAETAAGFTGLFFIGITLGRAVSGFLTVTFNNHQMIRLGQGLTLTGISALFLPFGEYTALAGIILIGLGCAPIYPCFIHSTPSHFGKQQSQAVIGILMAGAYIGMCIMPPLFGVIANHISIALLPFFLLMLLVVMIVMHEKLLQATGNATN